MKKTSLIAITAVAAMTLVSCNNSTTSQRDGNGSTEATSDNAEPFAPINITVEGEIDHTTYTGEVESTVTFDRFPQNAEEFNFAVKELGQEPQGAVVLMLMAMELYRNDSIAGVECLKTINTETNLPGAMRQIKEKLRPNNPNDSYARPYLVAAFMQGATPENGYNPPTPYKVKVRTHPVNSYEESNSLKGYVLHLQVESQGYDTPWRGVDVCMSKGDSHYRIVNCPSMYTQCKEISWKTDAEFKGLK